MPSDPPDKIGSSLSPRPLAKDIWLTADELGFGGDEATGRTRDVGGNRFVFRPLRRLVDLVAVEQLQLDVFGLAEREVIPASELVVVAETGGEVIGAAVAGAEEDDLAGALVGWGGFVDGAPRIVSDLLAVHSSQRGFGIGADLKRLQALIAIRRGFREIVWTVDPLRAANARLNLAKLGAVAHRYERDRYGTGFGGGLYGRMPTDRLHMVWDLTSKRTRDRLISRDTVTTDFESIPPFSPAVRAPATIIEIPTDIDRLLTVDPDAAMAWRFAVRSNFEAAFADGWEVRGFGNTATRAAYILVPRDTFSSDEAG